MKFFVKYQTEENRLRKDEELRLKREEESKTAEEKLRKKEEEKARREAILHQFKMKKELEKDDDVKTFNIFDTFLFLICPKRWSLSRFPSSERNH